MKRVLDPENPKDIALGRRICQLAKINPHTVARHDFTIHKNHITYIEYRIDPQRRVLLTRKQEPITKQRTIRNPLPLSAWHPSLMPRTISVTVIADYSRFRQALRDFVEALAHDTQDVISDFGTKLTQLSKGKP